MLKSGCTAKLIGNTILASLEEIAFSQRSKTGIPHTRSIELRIPDVGSEGIAKIIDSFCRGDYNGWEDPQPWWEVPSRLILFREIQTLNKIVHQLQRKNEELEKEVQVLGKRCSEQENQIRKDDLAKSEK
eukprot:TRINITY_DN6336_c0_g3_i1.p2 TRINITY_DN6336_c0_g3~~TRINITY_DN6336_c0_g3_i1.p2  ORF type:complete len:130 (+),score=25.16 TRINITY_DN6336_c0_g3_i1:511-900(+)